MLADMIVKLDSETHRKHVVSENGKYFIYLLVLRAIYRIIVAALLFYKEFCRYIKNIGFGFNPYYPRVAKGIKLARDLDIPGGQRHVQSCES